MQGKREQRAPINKCVCPLSTEEPQVRSPKSHPLLALTTYHSPPHNQITTIELFFAAVHLLLSKGSPSCFATSLLGHSSLFTLVIGPDIHRHERSYQFERYVNIRACALEAPVILL